MSVANVFEPEAMVELITQIKILEAKMIGSRTIPKAATGSSDWDLLCRVEDLGKSMAAAQSLGYKFDGSYPDNGKWVSMRMGKANLILTNDSSFYERMIIANKLAVKLELTVKTKRITLFDFIVEGKLGE